MPNRVEKLADALEYELSTNGTPERAVQEKRYLKSSLRHFGVSMPAVVAIAKAFRREHPDLAHDDLVALVDELWPRGIFECRSVAVELLEFFPDRLGRDDADLLERLIRDSHTWALVDGLAASVLGPLVERFPALQRTMRRWAKDEDFWIRRASLLSQLRPLRGGRTDLTLFGELADPMLEEKEFFIRKAIGWVLREASKKNPSAVFEWLRPRATRASPLTLREATKYLAPQQTADLLRDRTSGGRRAPRPRRARA
jgi:3-methyladenine DNA glycosylase AlkD